MWSEYWLSWRKVILTIVHHGASLGIIGNHWASLCIVALCILLLKFPLSYRFSVPRSIAMVITTLQLVQMVVGCVVNYWTYQMKQDGLECQVSDTNIKLSLLMYISYFVLFARFFYNVYLKPKYSEKTKKRD